MFTIQTKYGLPTGTTSICGWIEPDGTYFPCECWAHLIAETIICEAMNINAVPRYLEDHGWVRCTPPQLQILSSIDIHFEVTSEQVAAAREVLLIMKNEFVAEKFRKELNRIDRLIFAQGTTCSK